MPITPGTRVGQYEVQEFIGQGAMGLVYRAYHPDLERTVAVKVLQAIAPDADTVARFRHEAQAIAHLRHPNIVDVYDFGAFEGTPYMVVEYVPGGSLATLMNREMLDQRIALRYLRGIAAGLDYAHRHGVVHRDVKPANVLLTAEDIPVLADFGLAKLLQGSSLKSMTGVTTGTPAYMAPEQVMGHQVGPAADRYSLATIAYEMLTGVIPFDGEALMELLYAQVHRDPPTPSSRQPSLTPAVDAVVMRGLAKDPAARWESSAAFVDALEGALEGAPAPAVAKTVAMAPPFASTVPLARAAVADRVAAPAQPATVAMAYPEPTSAAQPVRRSRKRLVGILAGAAIVLLLIGTFALVALARSPTLTLSSYTVAPGEHIVVTATRMPANQNGEIQLWSVLHTFPFHADSGGNLSVDITVPRDIGFGDHLVKLCYNGSCHAQQTLHVVSRVALASPTPIGNQTPGTSPSASPTSTPSSSTTPHPSSTPTAKPTPPPSPTAKPTPTPSPSVSVNSITLTATSVTFHYFYGGTTTVYVCQNGTCHSAGPRLVGSGPNVVVTFPTPSGILVTAPPLVGQAYVYTACCGPTASVNVTA